MSNQVTEMALDDYIKQSRKQEKVEKKTLKGVKPSKTLHVSNIHLDVTEMDLYKVISEKGTLTECQLKKDQFGRSLGKAKVTFESLEQSERGLKELQGFELKG
jgi:RNA recognition motif-containing protein